MHFARVEEEVKGEERDRGWVRAKVVAIFRSESSEELRASVCGCEWVRAESGVDGRVGGK